MKYCDCNKEFKEFLISRYFDFFDENLRISSNTNDIIDYNGFFLIFIYFSKDYGFDCIYYFE